MVEAKSLKEWFSSPEKWCKYQSDKRADDGKIEACCLVGAIDHVYGSILFNEKLQILKRVIEIKYHTIYAAVSIFNDDDNIKFEDIVKVVELADI